MEETADGTSARASLDIERTTAGKSDPASAACSERNNEYTPESPARSAWKHSMAVFRMAKS